MSHPTQHLGVASEMPDRPALASRAALPHLPSALLWTSAEAPPGCLNLLHAFRVAGGVVSADALLLLLRERADQPLSLLARWIANRQVLSFECQSQMQLPMFQFDLSRAMVHPGLRPVMAELNDVFDERELAEWFATSNSWLSGSSPLALFADDPQAVLQAARADRFVAKG